MVIHMYSMDYDSLNSLYTDLTNFVKDMVDNIKSAKDIVDKMNNKDHWKGNGYDGYQKKFSALASNFGAYCNEIYKLNNNIKTSMERIKNIDAQVMAQLNL